MHSAGETVVRLELSEREAWRLLALLKRAAEQEQERSYWLGLAGRLASGIYRVYTERNFNGRKRRV